jgi:hypothetical protein
MMSDQSFYSLNFSRTDSSHFSLDLSADQTLHSAQLSDILLAQKTFKALRANWEHRKLSKLGK